MTCRPVCVFLVLAFSKLPYFIGLGSSIVGESFISIKITRRGPSALADGGSLAHPLSALYWLRCLRG